MVKNATMEIVHDGWLIKSPPEKRIWKAKWRERWFVLRHSGQLPGQFVLEYYTDQSRRKLKGRIDLDQCEQVDSGIQFEGHKFNYEHVFDIRTPKRTYYLVAKTEESMNKWVDCICAVCGLKIHVDEEFASQHEQLLASASTPSLTNSEASTTVPLTTPSSEGEPYILMSECISGPQILNGSLNSSTDILRNPSPVPPPKPGKHDRNLSGEFYDYPRPLNPSHHTEKGRTSPEPNFEDMYKIPPPARTSDYNSEWEGSNDPWTPPPRVNWSTYPRDLTPSLSDTVPRTELEIVRREAQEIAHHLERLSFNDSGVESQHSSSPQEMFESIDGKDALAEVSRITCPKPPPRPPKPPSLIEKRRQSSDKEEVILPLDNTALGVAMAYDTPPPTRGLFPPKKLPLKPHPILYSNDDKIKNDDLSPTTAVPPPPTSTIANMHLDDMYDFPKQRMDVLNATVPLGKSHLRRPRKHSYANAPPGYFVTKEACVFNYEYRPSLPGGDGYLSMDTNRQSETYTDMCADSRSPTSPLSMSTYLNVPPPSPGFLGPQLSDVPPAVNRNLKPGRKPLGDETVNSMTLPLVSKRAACIRSTSTKRSFRKPRAAPSPTPLSGNTPKAPSKHHLPNEQSTSEDELSSNGGSRRNSANDDLPIKHSVPPPPPPKKMMEIQYLDLDLDSEIVQSPKSPEKPSTSTVYKTVDFVKTKAFNEMRQNVEESYRQKK